MPNKYIMTKNKQTNNPNQQKQTNMELRERIFVVEGMKSAKQIFENQKTKNENHNLHNLTSVHHQLRKKKNKHTTIEFIH